MTERLDDEKLRALIADPKVLEPLIKSLTASYCSLVRACIAKASFEELKKVIPNMSTQIVMVPPNWKHPKKNVRGVEKYKHLIYESFAEAHLDWEIEKEVLLEPPPEPVKEDYVPFGKHEATWFQIWTFSPGSLGFAITPPFETLEKLSAYLTRYGTHLDRTPWSRHSAEDYCKLDKDGAPYNSYHIIDWET